MRKQSVLSCLTGFLPTVSFTWIIHASQAPPRLENVEISSVFAFLGASAAGLKVASARLPSPKTLVGSPAQILAQFPKQQSPKHLQQGAPLGASGVSQTHTSSSTSPVSKPTIQIKQESGTSDQLFLLPVSFGRSC